LAENTPQANLVQFDNAFSGIGVKIGMVLQCTFKSFCYRVAPQAWVKCFHNCSHDTRYPHFCFRGTRVLVSRGGLSNWPGLERIDSCLDKIRLSRSLY